MLFFIGWGSPQGNAAASLASLITQTGVRRALANWSQGSEAGNRNISMDVQDPAAKHTSNREQSSVQNKGLCVCKTFFCAFRRLRQELRVLYGDACGMEFLERGSATELEASYHANAFPYGDHPMQVLIIFPAAILVNDLYIIPLLTCCCPRGTEPKAAASCHELPLGACNV